ncbi:carbohydrate-binding module family 13 [Trichoderma arundinaceum]|uniref:Carbohydrate-binding module family 13 n=1 Tax=Trichoderma arundinaceum TaxID=490622 RepID=A0A395NNG5_TRIAR|nr:carbohydrate-binding module family 13 [Trichoderma arundinaceum]
MGPKAGTYVIASVLDKNPVLDLEGGSDTNPLASPLAYIVGYTNQRTENQQWRITPLRPGVYSLQCVFGNGWLTAPAGGGVDQVDTSIYDPRYNEATRWKITDAGNGNYQIESVQFPGRVLDVAGGSSDDNTRVILYPNYQSTNQKWQFIPVII